ncbi:hypothetical protein PoB_001178300 [Plakobranchus ocellatus]|uniref:Uncharacterized protein n=1 Tax=Plakobranchus ocellatus TaxID=259542 RepID=A0AAV3YRT6_9GAST|nr:hypothetical protein PoB_001178300 [Plakobranchus ocellatus]
MLENVYMTHRGLIMILIDDVRIYLTGKQQKLRAAAFFPLDQTVSNRFNPPSTISPTRDIKSQCSSPPSRMSPYKNIEIRCFSLPSPIFSTGIWKGSAPVRHRQYPPPGIPKISTPVRHDQYVPPGIPKASLQSAIANIPHKKYRQPVPQTALSNNITWLRK